QQFTTIQHRSLRTERTSTHKSSVRAVAEHIRTTLLSQAVGALRCRRLAIAMEGFQFAVGLGDGLELGYDGIELPTGNREIHFVVPQSRVHAVPDTARARRRWAAPSRPGAQARPLPMPLPRAA